MKRTSSHRKNHVLKWKQSGLSMKQYCLEHGISYWSFREWKIKFETEGEQTDAGIGFVEVPVALSPPQKGYEPIEIVLLSGIRIIVKENSGTEYLKDIVRVLEGLS